MSMPTSISYGYGFYLPEYEEEKFRQFLVNHNETILKRTDIDEASLLFLAAEEKNLSYNKITERYCDMICDTSDNTGVFSIIANIIKDETDLCVQYEPGNEDCGSKPAILLSTRMPWEYNENELSKSQEDVHNILYSYLCELTSKPEQYPIDYLSIENIMVKEVCMERLKFKGLKEALITFENNGRYSKRGPWKIVKGGYDKLFEISYNNNVVIECIDKELFNCSIDNFIWITDLISLYEIIFNMYKDLRKYNKAICFGIDLYLNTNLDVNFFNNPIEVENIKVSEPKQGKDIDFENLVSKLREILDNPNWIKEYKRVINEGINYIDSHYNNNNQKEDI